MVPFIPSGRNEDGLFGLVSAWAEPSRISLHVPFGVIHDSPRQSKYRRDETALVDSPRAWEIIAAALRDLGPEASLVSIEDRLRHFGKKVHEIGNSPLSTFRDYFSRVVVANRTSARDKVESLIHTVPAHWASALSRYLHSLNAELDDERGAALPIEFSGQLGEDKGWLGFQRFVERFLRNSFPP